MTTFRFLSSCLPQIPSNSSLFFRQFYVLGNMGDGSVSFIRPTEISPLFSFVIVNNYGWDVVGPWKPILRPFDGRVGMARNLCLTCPEILMRLK